MWGTIRERSIFLANLERARTPVRMPGTIYDGIIEQAIGRHIRTSEASVADAYPLTFSGPLSIRPKNISKSAPSAITPRPYNCSRVNGP